MGNVMKIASSEGVGIHCQKEGKFSFFNSPYPAHGSYTGIDIYPKQVFGGTVSSPVRGEVTKIRQVKCPKGKRFESSRSDYVILLRSLENSERVVKVLHVKPIVQVGDMVEPGEDFGVLLRSGFFDFWTDPHIHIEIRTPSDPIRARGGFKFERCMEVDAQKPSRELTGIVVESKAEYSLISLHQKLKHGVPVSLEGEIGLLDGGVPHYGWFGVHLKTNPLVGTPVRLCGKEIGTVKSTYSNTCVAECDSPAFKLEGEPVRLSFYIYPSSTPLVKIIPQRPGELILKNFEEVAIDLLNV